MKKLLKFGIVSLSVATLSGFLPGQLNQGLTEQLTVYAEDGQADSTSTETEGSVTETKEESVTESVSPEDKVVEEVEAEGAEEVAEETVADESEKMAEESPSSDIPPVATSTRSMPEDEVVEIESEGLKHELLKWILPDEKKDEYLSTARWSDTESGPLVLSTATGEWKYAEHNPKFLDYPITRKELDSIDSLSINNLSVFAYSSFGFSGSDSYDKQLSIDLKELEKLTALEELSLNGDEISLSDLPKLSNLRRLSLSKIAGTFGLPVLPNLRELSLYDMTADATDLARYDLLEEIHYYAGYETNYELLNLKELEKLSNLKKLYLSSGLANVDISKLSNVETLETLDIWGGGAYNLGSLAQLPNLKHLNTSIANKKDLEELVKSPSLESLTFVVDSAADLPDFSSLSSLKSLNITVKDGRTDELDFSKIVAVPNLTYLRIEGTYYDYEKSESWPSLAVRNGHLIGQMKGLKGLALSGLTNGQELVAPISSLNALQDLLLIGNNLTDVSEFTKLSNLLFLDMGKNQIPNIADFSKLPKLRTLGVSDNPITNIDEFWDKKNFSLDLVGTPILKNHSDEIAARWNELNNEFFEKRDQNLATENDRPISIIRMHGGKGGGGPIEVAGNWLYGHLDWHLANHEETPDSTILTDVNGSSLTVIFNPADGAKTLEVIAHIEPTAATPAPIERLAGQDFDLYDIVVKDEQGNLLTDLNHKALVKLPVDEGKTVIKVIYLPDTGQAEELPILKQEDGFVYFEVEHFSHYGIVYEGQVTPPAPEENTPPKDEVKTKTITIVEERQDVDGRVVFTKTHTFVLKPDQVETLPLDQTVDQLIRGSNIAAYNAYEDGAVIHFTTRKRPTTQDQTPKDPSAEEMAAVIAEIEKLATELVSLGGTPRHYLLEVIEKVKAGDVQAYKAYDFVNIKAGLLEQIAEAKKAPETPTPKVLTDQDLTTFAEIARLYDEVIALGGKPWDQLHGIAEIAKSGDKERMTKVLYSYENIRGFVTRLENQLAELKKAQETPKPELKDLSSARNKLLLELDKSSLTDQQKGQLAEKIAFAETEKDLTMIREAFAKLTKPADKKESGRTTAPVAAAQSGTEAVAKSAKAGLPATGDRGELGLLTAGLTLILASLGLTKKRRN